MISIALHKSESVLSRVLKVQKIFRDRTWKKSVTTSAVVRRLKILNVVNFSGEFENGSVNEIFSHLSPSSQVRACIRGNILSTASQGRLCLVLAEITSRKSPPDNLSLQERGYITGAVETKVPRGFWSRLAGTVKTVAFTIYPCACVNYGTCNWTVISRDTPKWGNRLHVMAILYRNRVIGGNELS